MSDTVRTIRVVVDSRQAEQGADRSKRALRGLGDEANRASRMFGFLKTALIGIGTSMVIREFARLADQAKTLNAQLLIVEGSMGKVRDRSRELVDMSIRTGTALDANVELYTKLARALQGAGYDSSKFLRVTETVSKALVLSGADAGTTSAVVRQLGQALASGSIRGDEFISVMEGAPVLMQELAKQIGRPIGELRTLAADGKLTTKTLVDAFTSIDLTSTIDRQFEMMPMTFGRAVQNIKTAATVVFGEFDRGGQFSDSILNFAKFGAKDIESLADAAMETGIDIRSAFSGLGDLFDPMLDGAASVFDAIGVKSMGLRDQIKEVLDIVYDLWTANDKMAAEVARGIGDTADLLPKLLTGGRWTPASDRANRWADNLDNKVEQGRWSTTFGNGFDASRNSLRTQALASRLPGFDQVDVGGLGKALGLRTEIAAQANATADADSKSAKELKKAADEAANRLKAANDNLESASRELELVRATWDGDVERTRLRHELADIDKMRAGLSKAELAILGPILDKQKQITEEIFKQARYAEEAADAVRRMDPGALHDPEKDLADLKKGYEAAGRAGGRALRDESLLAAEAFGQAIGGKVGGIVKQLAGVLQGMKSGDFTGVDGPMGGLMTLFGGRDNGWSMTAGGGQLPGGGVMSGLPDLTGKGGFSRGMQEAFDNAAKPFKSVAKEISTSFGLDGAFTKTLGKAFGGAAVGTATSGVMKALGIKTSQTGAQIGGAVGSFLPIPGGEIIGSIVGGIIGGMFKKAKTGMATITSVDGDATLSGNSNKRKQAAAGLAGSVQSGLSGIADALGADLGSFSVSIGMRDDKYRVNPSGSGKTKIKNGAVDFGSDAEGAMKFAIRDAIRDGALLGISEFSQRILKGNTDLDKALDVATKYEQVLDALAADANGITAAADAFAETFETLITEMKKAGATAEELANVETLYGREREKALKSLLDPLLDYQKGLSGEGSGVTALDRFNTSKLEYEQAKSDFAAGNIDQNTFTAAGQELFGLARDIFGTATSEFQSIRQQLLADSIAAIETATEAFNGGAPDKLLAAQEASNTIATQQYQQLAILNGKQDQIIAALAALHGGGAISGRYVNGVWQAAA